MTRIQVTPEEIDVMLAAAEKSLARLAKSGAKQANKQAKGQPSAVAWQPGPETEILKDIVADLKHAQRGKLPHHRGGVVYEWLTGQGKTLEFLLKKDLPA
jgi:hypothetical protein